MLNMKRNYICVINWARGPDKEILTQIRGQVSSTRFIFSKLTSTKYT